MQHIKNQKNDNYLVRTYLALAMGRTLDKYYGDALMVGLSDENPNSKSAAMHKCIVGMIKYQPAVDKIKVILDTKLI